jgi:predicted transposase YdaD
MPRNSLPGHVLYTRGISIMSGHRPWREIREKLRADPERRARIEQRERAIAEGLTIGQMRKARGDLQKNHGSHRKSSSSEPTQQG